VDAKYFTLCSKSSTDLAGCSTTVKSVFTKIVRSPSSMSLMLFACVGASVPSSLIRSKPCASTFEFNPLLLLPRAPLRELDNEFEKLLPLAAFVIPLNLKKWEIARDDCDAHLHECPGACVDLSICRIGCCEVHDGDNSNGACDANTVTASAKSL
jgi:hypothetical protein